MLLTYHRTYRHKNADCDSRTKHGNTYDYRPALRAMYIFPGRRAGVYGNLYIPLCCAICLDFFRTTK